MLADSFSEASCGEAASSQEAIQLAMGEPWDLIILELSLGCYGGLDLLKQIRRMQPQIPVLVFTAYGEQQYALRAIRAGAVGYVTKVSCAAEVVRAVKKVAQGGRFISATLAETLSAHLQKKSPESVHDQLSDRECQVMRLIGTGKTICQIALLLSISDKTVSTYRARILEKTGMKTTAQLIRYMVELGFID